MQAISNLAGRILLSYMFIFAGWQKLVAYSGTAHYLQSLGIPAWLLPFVILLELGGGIAILAGAFTRVFSVSLAVFCVLTAFMVHFPAMRAATDPNIHMLQMLNVMKNLVMAGGFLVLASTGAGKFSLDEKLGLGWK